MITAGPDCTGNSFSNFRKKWVREIRQKQSNRIRASRNQAAGNPVHLVIQLLSSLQHALASAVTDLALIAQNLGDGYDRDIEISGDIHHGYGHGGQDTTKEAR